MGMRKSRLSKIKQERLMEHFVAGTTARCAAELIGVNRKTAAYYYHRLREIIYKAREDEMPFAGEIEVDESYFGGRRKGNRRYEGQNPDGYYAEAGCSGQHCVHGCLPFI